MAQNVFYFNPTCELAIANGSFSYMPPQLLRDFEEDCSVLPFIFSDTKDYLLTENIPTLNFSLRLRDLGFELPQFASLKDMMNVSSFNQLLPWGWSPSAHFILNPLKYKCSAEFMNSPVFNWTEEHKSLFERKTSLVFLNTLLQQYPFDFFIERENTGTIFSHAGEIEIRLNRQSPLVLKAPLSSSGRGIQMIRKAELNTSNRQWISGVLKQQGYLIAEPYLEKITDLSFQFRITDSGKPEYLGYSIFETNSNGQYKNTLIHPKITNLVPQGWQKEVHTMIEITADVLTQKLSNSIFSTWHRGLMGIDAMIYKDGKEIKIQPCIEINSRMNMGILALQLEKYLHPETSGKFELFYGKQGEYNKFTIHMEKENTLRFKDGKLYSGFLALTEPGPTKQFGAWLQIEGL